MNGIQIAMTAVAAAECFFTPWFIRAQWPKKTKKSLVLKMICASLFVAMGALAMAQSRNFSTFALLMLCGLAASWWGDFFLHVSPREIFFLLGLLSFLTGHVFYACAYSNAVVTLFPGERFFNFYEIAAVVVIVGIALVLQKIKFKIDMGHAALPLFAYTTVLMLMFVKACSLAVRFVIADRPHALPAALLLALGALCFVLSDSTLLFIMFDHRRAFKLKAFNLVTYFAAQILLALSILFVQ